ncbi:methyl-accepting chemotaxis protein [Erwinia pyri]|uniref:Methyl-accepting chemotaxis protein n=1 Tax=Erwinia pyri TaxID=3062598 RepID=A0AA50DQU5_9GAMM|nr:methyl-accepting chemotaxis protein [Erwinia sp. DE2]WLS80520.1 methyl-accepting chemotaxis protein [Erwinia sp. DE2]
MSLKKSSLLVLCFLFVLFFTSMVTNIWLLTRSNHSLGAVNQEIRVVLSIIDPINHSRTLRVRLMEYMATLQTKNQPPSAQDVENIKSVLGKADAAFNAYLTAPRLSGETELTAAYRDTYQAYRQQGIEPLIDAASVNDLPRFNAQLANVIRLDHQYEQVLDQVLALHEAYARRLDQEAKYQFRFGIGLTAAFGGVFLIMVVGVMIFLRRYVLAPLDSAKNHCAQIAQGMLAEPVPVKPTSRSEIQDLMRTLEQMRCSLTGIISQVRHATHSVAGASQEIAFGNADLASRTEQQAAALTETAASMEQLGATVKQNTENVFEASRLTGEAVKNARTGEKVSREVIVTMGLINNSSKKIEDITGVINSIAFQTNILALNAAVEAARAGEQGRGFAVVAAEVRNLAQRSAVAAKEIESLIAESVVNIRAGSEQVSRTGEVIGAIITSVSQVDVLMEHISTASGEQSLGISQIEQAVTEMDSVTQQNSALVQQSAAASASLEDQVQHLTQSVSTFRLAEE